MDKYIFICIGTNKLIEDSFGPRVGDILLDKFENNEKIKIFGTMEKPIHLKNGEEMINKIYSINRYEDYHKIIIDSAYSANENIGKIYVNLGGIVIGKAYSKGVYIPADLNVKTVVMNNKRATQIKDDTQINKMQIIQELSYITAKKIIEIIK